MHNAPPQKITLGQIAQQFADMDTRYKSTLILHYSLDGRLLGNFQKIDDVLEVSTEFWHPVMLGIVEFKGKKFKRWVGVLGGGDPVPVYRGEITELPLPDGKYLMAASPVIHGERHDDEITARNTILAAIGVLACMHGRAIILDSVGELIAHPSGKETYATPAVRAPQKHDGLGFRDQSMIGECFAALTATTDTEKRGRILYALTMVGRAMQEDDERFRFTEYWIALEVLAQGLGKEVTKQLAAAYGTNQKFVLDNLEFRKAIRLRNDLLHKGRFGDFNARFERLLQCYVLDLVRAQLDLQCRRLTATMKGGIAELEAGDAEQQSTG